MNLKSSGVRTMSDTENENATHGGGTTRKYPPEAGVLLAAKEGSQRYYFRSPTGGIASVPAMDAEQARDILAGGVRGFGPGDFHQVNGFDAEPWEYPDPVNSDREVNEHDIWVLRCATHSGSRVGMYGKYDARKNPTEYTLEALLDEWDNAVDIPLHDRSALQQADGIGPDRAAQVVGAAVANRLIERPVRSEQDE